MFGFSTLKNYRVDNIPVAAYKRVAVILASGTQAWVYVDARYAPKD